MDNFVFITDLHISNICNVRNGDVLEDICNKLIFVKDYCNQHDCILLLGGDIFDKPTVPDFVKSRVIEIFKQFNNPIYSISGNHDRLYNNVDYNYRTSYQLMLSSGIFNDLDSVDGIDLGSVYLTSKKPVLIRKKPQLVICHGFLNQDDGDYTFRYSDIQSDDQIFVLLGHLHDVCDDINIGKVRYIRPGSFLRGIRSDAQQRTPQLVHIICDNGVLKSKKVPVQSRSWESIFQSKEFKITKAQQHKSYEDIINQIRSVSSSDLTFEQALKQVASPDVVEFAMHLLSDYNLNKSVNRINV